MHQKTCLKILMAALIVKMKENKKSKNILPTGG
jgi:hypothetical protein